MNAFLEARKSVMKESRSTIPDADLQEVLDAEVPQAHSSKWGTQQYFTPPSFVTQCVERMGRAGLSVTPATVLDPQVGDGALINLGTPYAPIERYGIDIDSRLEKRQGHINGNCVRVFEAIDDLYPELTWVCINANPPFGKKWKQADGSTVDSTKATWEWVIRHGCYGFFIGTDATLKQLGIDKHKYVFDYWTPPNPWHGVDVQIAVAFWQINKNAFNYSPPAELRMAWGRVDKLIKQERGERPEFNIYLDGSGLLRTYLSVRSEVKLKLDMAEVMRLHRINECHPITLTTEKETRELMRSLVDCGTYTIQPQAKAAIEAALAEMNHIACPIMPVTPFETVAYADEEDALECIQTVHTDRMHFTKGKRYKLDTGVYRFKQKYKRNKVHFSETTRETYTSEHDCELTGQDRYIAIVDDKDQTKRFMDRPENEKHDFDEATLWSIFQKPHVPTVAEVCADKVAHNIAVLKSCELVAGYRYYPGQLKYLAPFAVKDYGLAASAVGTGKTLLALSLVALKAPDRCLIVAPQGSIRGSSESEDAEDSTDYNASQWLSEIHKFAPYLQIFELFSMEDYQRICALNGGQLPPGVYVTYYEALFKNGARETAPESWDDVRLEKEMNTITQRATPLPTHYPPPLQDVKITDPKRWCRTVGQEKNGVRCIVSPCMATQIGSLFDMVMLDEAHLCTNLDANVTQMLIRLQPKYRYAFTATPIPNIVSNLFSLMGWLCVDGWYEGNRRNSAWPFARHELGRFNDTFLCMERDFTQEELNRQRDPEWDGKCIKNSPVISSPARLLKLLKPTMAYASKHDMNPDYKDAKIIDVRVPMGKEQARLYAYYLDRGNIPASNALVRARKQTQWLRNICADPAGFRHGDARTPKVHSNMNPKVVATLELVRDILAQKEQVLIISARLGLTNTIQEKLFDAGARLARIDSTMTPDHHAAQANLFKEKKADVLLMGIKCAMAYSFPQCKYIIVIGIEFSPGPLTQCLGRIDRVNSRPGVTAYIILHKHSLEEIMWDTVAQKDDAATICLRGKRIPRNFKPVDPGEILAQSIEHFDTTGATPEPDCEAQWPELRKRIKAATL